jgi:hypothetical protein
MSVTELGYRANPGSLWGGVNAAKSEAAPLAYA